VNEIITINENEELLAFNELIIPQSAYSTGKYNYQQITAFYISDLHLRHHLNEEEPILEQIKKIVKGLFDKKLIEMMRSWNEFIVIFGGDISDDSEICQMFYHEFMLFWDENLFNGWKELHRYSLPTTLKEARKKYEKEWKPRFPVFAVLGNHELHDFDTVMEAERYYRAMLSNEGICFLHNEFIRSECFDERSWSYNGYIVLGGPGFAKFNDKYNANTVIGAKTMDREQEIRESELFYSIYQEALKEATDNEKLLVVISHYPTKDWLPEENHSIRCVYFTGHTHRNNSVHSDGVHIYANNQVGYHKKTIRFKYCVLGTCFNPFIEYEDGTYEITPEQYSQFYDYNNDSLAGTGGIDRQLETGNATFYMIKQSGFYGFFVINRKTGAKICVGGTVRNVSKALHIRYFSQSFSAMISQFVKAMMPYRRYQEKIAAEIKELGYEGRIHGCIIDLDDYNHIMINPMDGQVTYYYSPAFGWVYPYRTLNDLISGIEDYGMEELIEQKKKALAILEEKRSSDTFLMCKNCNELSKYTKRMVKIDIKNSLYSTSARINQLQRLFDSNILRDWNDELAQAVVPEAWAYMPKQRVFTIKGEKAVMRCGMECTVIEDREYNDITVQFEDGAIKHTTRDKFRQKCVPNPNRITTRAGGNTHDTKTKGTFAALYPDLLVDWDYKNNSLNPEEIIPGTNSDAQWKCHKCGYAWTARIDKRCMGKSICKVCRHRAIERDARMRRPY